MKLTAKDSTLRAEIPYLFAAIAVGSLLSWSVFKAEEPPALGLPNYYETAELALENSLRNVRGITQKTNQIAPGKFVNNNFVYFPFKKLGDWVQFRLPVRTAGYYLLTLRAAKTPDFGIMQISINGKPIGQTINLYSPGIDDQISEAFEVRLNGETDTIRLTAVGKDPDATPPYFQIGLDGLQLEKNPKTGHIRAPKGEPLKADSVVAPGDSNQPQR